MKITDIKIINELRALPEPGNGCQHAVVDENYICNDCGQPEPSFHTQRIRKELERRIDDKFKEILRGNFA